MAAAISSAQKALFSQSSKLVKGTTWFLNPFRLYERTKSIKGKDHGAGAKMAAGPKNDNWPFSIVNKDDYDDDDDDDWLLVDIFEVEALEHEAESQDDPLNVNKIRDLAPRVDYFQVTLEAFRDFMGGKKKGFRQIGW